MPLLCRLRSGPPQGEGGAQNSDGRPARAGPPGRPVELPGRQRRRQRRWQSPAWWQHRQPEPEAVRWSYEQRPGRVQAGSAAASVGVVAFGIRDLGLNAIVFPGRSCLILSVTNRGPQKTCAHPRCSSCCPDPWSPMRHLQCGGSMVASGSIRESEAGAVAEYVWRVVLAGKLSSIWSLDSCSPGLFLAPGMIAPPSTHTHTHTHRCAFAFVPHKKHK